MAANVDTLATVTALADPAPRTVLLDQLIAFAGLEGIAALVILTKPDLAPAVEVDRYESLYRRLGYDVVILNPKLGLGIGRLRHILAHRRSLLCGISGVGKSSIFRALGGTAEIGEISRRRLGRQTTTAARLCRIDGGFLIDSPGIGEFGLGTISAPELAAAFVEMREPATQCRFTDCAHVQEPGCGVRAAAERGEIDPSRYNSYRQLLGNV